MTTFIVTLVITMMAGGHEYERNIPMDSLTTCLSQATQVLNKAAVVPVDTKDEAEVGAGCVIKFNPNSQPA